MSEHNPVPQNIIKHQCHDWRTLPTSHELDAAAEHAPHVRAGDLHDVDGGRGQHEAQPQAGQEPAMSVLTMMKVWTRVAVVLEKVPSEGL